MRQDAQNEKDGQPKNHGHQNRGRIHALDHLRAVAMLLGIVLHGAIAHQTTVPMSGPFRIPLGGPTIGYPDLSNSICSIQRLQLGFKNSFKRLSPFSIFLNWMHGTEHGDHLWIIFLGRLSA